ncbi:hypothetical protein ACDL92_04780 [Ihubacter sp. mB4P-1]|uniref:hypothetical protein n=1 Tax=Ihubacter sp. mB4P-1 TaxID=3242370 RepID=UPI00137A6C63
MRRIISLLLVLILVLSTATLCYGQTSPVNPIEPAYVGTAMHVESFKINDGVSTSVAYILPKTKTSFDKVTINIKIAKATTGVVYYDKTFTTYYDSIRGWFHVSKDYTLPSKGTYSMDATYKCYKDGKLIETIKGATKISSYQ